MILPRQVSARRAAEVLGRVFGHIATGFTFRLWDGTQVPVGAGAPVCTTVVHRPETFIRLLRDPSPLTFAEAYVEGAIDIEGDLSGAMTVANAIEGIRVSAAERLRILWSLWKG